MTREIDPKRLAALNDSYKGREYSDAYDPIKQAANRIPDLQTTVDRIGGTGSTFHSSRTVMLSLREQTADYFKNLDDPDRKPPRARKLTNEMISNIKTELNKGTPSKKISEAYHVSQTTISFINTGSQYPDIEPLTNKQLRKIRFAV